MSQVPDESPADEYERRCEDRRRDAVAAERGCSILWTVAHLGAVLSMFLSVFVPGVSGFGGAAGISFSGVLWLLSAVPAVLSLVVLARDWDVLTAREKADCAAPAGLMLLETSLAAVWILSWYLLA